MRACAGVVYRTKDTSLVVAVDDVPDESMTLICFVVCACACAGLVYRTKDTTLVIAVDDVPDFICCMHAHTHRCGVPHKGHILGRGCGRCS